MNITELCDKYTHWDTTLGTDKSSTHQYAQHVYENEFAPYKDSSLNLLEIGISGGHSLKVWSEYFTQATIYGLDISLDQFKVAPVPDNVRVILGDGTKPEVFESLPSFTLVIDDASHSLHDQLETFKIVFPTMQKGGLYIIEDIQDFSSAKAAFEQLNPNFEIFDIREHSGRYDDVIFLYRT
jgi:hypothetical protein